MSIKTDFNEITIKVVLLSEIERPHPNMLANASITIRGKLSFITITGFIIWRSKYDEYNIEVPKKKNFKFCYPEKSLWKAIQKQIIEQYEQELIPIED